MERWVIPGEASEDRRVEDSLKRPEFALSGEHLTPADVEAYWSRRLGPDRLRRTLEHLEDCAACQERLTCSPYASTAARRLKSQVLADPHLDYETLTGFLDETLDAEERSYAASHLKNCRRCTEDLEGIRLVSLPVSVPQRSEEVNRAPVRRFEGWRRGWLLGPAVAAAVVVAFWLGRSSTPERSPLPGPVATSALPKELDALARQLAQVQRDLARMAAAAQQRPSGPTAPAHPHQVGGSGPELAAGGDVPASVRKALVSGALHLPHTVTSLFLPGEVLRGPGSEGNWITDLFPARTVIDNPRPLFTWKAGSGAWTYEVTVIPEEGKGELIHSGPLRSASWRLSVPLQRGQVYSWQVNGYSPDGRPFVTPTPKPRFRVLDAAGHRALAAARHRYRNQPLVLGVLLAEQGVLHEAQKQFEAIPEQDARASRVKGFLTQVRGGLRPPPAPDSSLPGTSPLLALPSTGVDASGRRYPRLVEAYSRAREFHQLSAPDEWVRPYGPGEEGRAQSFKMGKVKLVTRSGPGDAPAYCLAGDILEKYEQTTKGQGRGGAFGPLGWATSDEEEAPPSRNGQQARVQSFERGAIYHIATGPQKGKTFAIYDEPEANLFIYRRYVELGGCQGNRHRDPDLRYHPGLPDDNIGPAATNPATGQTGILGRFEGCQIYGVRGRGTFVVDGKISEKFELLGGTDDPIGFPIADRVKMGSSGVAPGVEGVAQEFEGGTLYWRRKGEEWDGEAFFVAGDLLKTYLGLGGVKGNLGFPVSDTAPVTSPSGMQGQRQSFEGGLLFSSRLGTYWVPAASATRYEAKLGFPREAPQADGRQRFEGGILTPVAP